MLSPLLVGLLLGLTALATVPARRLYRAGWGARSVATYVAGVVAVGLAVVFDFGPLRLTLPVLVVLAVAPYVITGLAERIAAARGGGGARWVRRRRSPPRIVGSGPGRTITTEERPSEEHEPQGGGTDARGE